MATIRKPASTPATRGKPGGGGVGRRTPTAAPSPRTGGGPGYGNPQRRQPMREPK